MGALFSCYICGSDFRVQARHIPYQCRVVTLCRLCAFRAVTHVIFKCACGRYDFIAKYPHRLRILAHRLRLPPSTQDCMANGLALVESASCTRCQTAAKSPSTVDKIPCASDPEKTLPGS
jgi:hypothetical protein